MLENSPKCQILEVQPMSVFLSHMKVHRGPLGLWGALCYTVFQRPVVLVTTTMCKIKRVEGFASDFYANLEVTCMILTYIPLATPYSYVFDLTPHELGIQFSCQLSNKINYISDCYLSMVTSHSQHTIQETISFFLFSQIDFRNAKENYQRCVARITGRLGNVAVGGM